MFLQSVAKATPPHCYEQSQVWNRIKEAPQVESLPLRSRALLEKVLCGDSGISRRSFVLPDPLALFAMGAEELNQHYEREAPKLAGVSLTEALERAGVSAGSLMPSLFAHARAIFVRGFPATLPSRLGFAVMPFCRM